MGSRAMRAAASLSQALVLALLVGAVRAIPSALDIAPEFEGSDYGRTIELIDEAVREYDEQSPDVEELSKELQPSKTSTKPTKAEESELKKMSKRDGIPKKKLEADLANAKEATKQKYTYADTLQHVANRFCTERRKRRGKGAVFCREIIGMQSTWIQAEKTGDIERYSGLLGMMRGHYCPTEKHINEARCLIMTLLGKGIPTNLRWNPERKRYLQLTSDVADHYCTIHGEGDMFCPLMKGLKKHFYEAVLYREAKGYVKYIKNLQNHYCSPRNEVEHPADERCNILPLLLKGLPELKGTPEDSVQGQVLANGGVGMHAMPGIPEGNVPAIDDKFKYRIDLKKEGAGKQL